MISYLKKYFTLTLLAIALPTAGFAQLNTIPTIELSQQEYSLVDAHTRMLVNRINHTKNMSDLEKYAKRSGGLHVSKNGQIMINLLIEASSASVENHLKNSGFQVSANTGSIIAGSIEIKNLKSLLETPGILRVELAQMRTLSHNQSLTDANVPPVHAGDQLSMSVTGAGVIVGIIDSGIDFTHPDFSDENGTRILYLIDYSDFDEEPTLWTKSDIDDDPDAVWHKDYNGHGTHVSGTAAGNGSFSEEFRGVAFESDIIAVGLGDNMSDDNIIAGIVAIKEFANQLGKPAVVNMSLGGHTGPHDGSSLFELAVTELAGDGFIIVAAAGNEAVDYIQADAALLENKSYEMNLRGQSSLAMISWFTNNSIEEVRLKLFSDPETQLYATDWVQAGSDSSFEINFEEALFAEVEVEIDAPGNNDGQLVIEIIIDDETDFGFDPFGLFWVVELKTGEATGSVHSWAFGNGAQFLPLDLFGKGDSFIAGNNSYSVGSPATALDVISVGSYITKNEWMDINGNEQFVFTRPDPFFGNGEQQVATVGNRSDFSSIGPTRDGRLAPIISAPGEMIFSVPSSSADNDTERINSDSYLGMEGTSMAAPHVAGIIALMLQVYPDMSYDEVISILSATARKDEFTGSTVNNEYGHGKIDAHAAVMLADQMATDLSEHYQLPEKLSLYQNYPNPFNPTTQIGFSLPQNEHIRLDIYNMLGQNVATIANGLFTAGTHQVSFDASRLASGLYMYRLRTEQGTVLTKKMLFIK